MVTVINYALRKKEGESKPYISLTLEGGIEMVQSQNTGRFYATVRTCVVSSTFDEDTAARMIGKEMPGTIERVPCDAYDFTIKETGEIIRMGYRWDYKPEGGRRVSMPRPKVTNLAKPSDEELKEEELKPSPETVTEEVK